MYRFLLVFFSNFVPKKAPFLTYSTSKYTVTLKTGFGVRQGHWNCHDSIECIRLSIGVL